MRVHATTHYIASCLLSTLPRWLGGRDARRRVVSNDYGFLVPEVSGRPKMESLYPQTRLKGFDSRGDRQSSTSWALFFFPLRCYRATEMANLLLSLRGSRGSSRRKENHKLTLALPLKLNEGWAVFNFFLTLDYLFCLTICSFSATKTFLRIKYSNLNLDFERGGTGKRRKSNFENFRLARP